MLLPASLDDQVEVLTQGVARRLDELQLRFQGSAITHVANRVASTSQSTERQTPAQIIEELRSTIEGLRALEEELHAARSDVESERVRYRDLFEFAPDGYLTTDARGKITDANRAAAALLNVPEQFVVTKPLLVYVAKEDRSRFMNAVHEMRHRDRGEWTFTICPREQASIVVHATAGAVRAWDGALQGLRWMIRDITEQRRVEEQIAANRRQLKSLTSELSQAEERERRRIATGIHDHISQRLAMVKMMLGPIRRGATDEQRRQLLEVGSMLDQAIEESRSLTFELSPPVLYELGLGPAVEWLGEQMQRRHGLLVRVRNRLKLSAMPIELRVLMFQATRELLTNTIKHAAAGSAAVTLSMTTCDGQAVVKVVVHDTGRGFETADLSPERAGFGLFNLRTRFEQIGGKFQNQITARPRHTDDDARAVCSGK